MTEESTPVSVLIVDDSALMRNLIGRIVENSSGLSVAGKAMNGEFALQKIPKTDPDVIILDLEMPQMNGIEFLKERKRLGIEIPVVILSSIAHRGAQITMEALALGASDFILKPTGSVSEEIRIVGSHIVETLLAYGNRYKQNRKTPRKETEPLPSREIRKTAPVIDKPRPQVSVPEIKDLPQRKSAESIEVVAIGISTGGPNALRDVFARIDPAFPVPILVVQHMPAGFTEEFAKSLDKICPLEVKEAAEGDVVKPGRVLIAPGNSHIELEKKALATIIRLNQSPPVNGHRPSADVLFSSVAKQFGPRSIAVIMTGMGRDGAKEIGAVHKAGGITLAQDEQSCVVFGMPRVAIENGFIQSIVPLKEMAEKLNALAGRQN